MLPGTIDGMKHVCYFRQALALDERRVNFLPEYAYGGTSMPPGTTEKGKNTLPVNHEPPRNDNGPPSGNADGTSANNELSEDITPIKNEATGGHSQARMKSMGKHPHTLEVWFAGTHSDM